MGQRSAASAAADDDHVVPIGHGINMPAAAKLQLTPRGWRQEDDKKGRYVGRAQPNPPRHSGRWVGRMTTLDLARGRFAPDSINHLAWPFPALLQSVRGDTACCYQVIRDRPDDKAFRERHSAH